MMQSSETNAQPSSILWMADLARPLLTWPAPRIPAVFKRVGPEVTQELSQAMGFDNPSIILQRFASGRHCYIARVKDKLATYGWVTFDEECIGELDLSFRLKVGEAYIWNCVTLPEYRGLRLYPALLAYILRELHNQGEQRSWICTDSDNLASQKGIALAGFQPVVGLFTAHSPMSHLSWSRGCPDTPKQLVTAVRQALSPAITVDQIGGVKLSSESRCQSFKQG